MSEEFRRPGVGIGVYIRKDGKVLLGLRKAEHGNGTWSNPGGHLELGESWEECARRETLEESGIEIENLHYVGATNDVYDSGKHYITLAMVADWKSGEPQVLEPEKCERWDWFAWDNLPQPLFLSTRNFVETGYNPIKI